MAPIGKGCVHIYTGNGKGKTTAAFGLALRAAGHGLRTYFAQFMKKGEYGEIVAVVKHLPELITVEQFGVPDFHHRDKGVSEVERAAAWAGIAAAEAALQSGKFNIVVLDEINTALHFTIVSLPEVMRLVRVRPAAVELVLTGRYAPEELCLVADLVTEMREIKHYYNQGLEARNGIEK